MSCFYESPDLEDSWSITISDVIEYLFCPRFIYFMHCLDIPQHEDKHFKVLKGRELHKEREKVNSSYVRKRLDVVRKETDVYLSSSQYHIRGIMDEILFMDDGSAAPLDFKFSEYQERMFRTHKFQSILYGLLITEHYGVPVSHGYVCYTRSKNKVTEIQFTDKMMKEALEIVQDIIRIIQNGHFPQASSNKSRCIDCCYRRICTGKE